MSLHQPPVPALPKRLETDRLLGPLRRLRGVAETQAGVAQHGQRADTDVVELAPFLLDPGAVLPWQERLRHQRHGQLGIGSRPFEIARRERLLGLVGRDRRCSQVDPRSFRQLEPVTTERVRQRASAVEARVRERAPQLARDHRQRLFPGRGRHRPQSTLASSSLGTSRPCSATRNAKTSRPCRPAKRPSSSTTPSVSTATRPARNTLSCTVRPSAARILPSRTKPCGRRGSGLNSPAGQGSTLRPWDQEPDSQVRRTSVRGSGVAAASAAISAGHAGEPLDTFVAIVVRSQVV